MKVLILLLTLVAIFLTAHKSSKDKKTATANKRWSKWSQLALFEGEITAHVEYIIQNKGFPSANKSKAIAALKAYKKALETGEGGAEASKKLDEAGLNEYGDDKKKKYFK